MHDSGAGAAKPTNAIPSTSAATVRLTSPALLSLEYFAPPPELAPYITTYYLLRCDEPVIADIQPAGVGLIAVFMRGAGTIHFATGHSDHSQATNLLTPTSAAAAVMVAGPWHCFGAALSPLGWAALTGRSAAKEANRLHDAGAYLGPDFAAAGKEITLAWLAGECSGESLAELLGAAIARNLRPVAPGHQRLVGCVADWLGRSLSPPVELLYERAGYSPRQVQRLAQFYFGSPPVVLARKYRALRAAALLSDPATTADQAAEIAGHFYDQPHLIHELRAFVGRTPSRLGADDDPLLSALIDVRNFREIAPRVAALPGSLRA